MSKIKLEYEHKERAPAGRIGIYLPDALMDAARERAIKDGVSVNELIRSAMRAALGISLDDDRK